MSKIVYNACFGGFSLSDAAIRRYAELKGLTLFPEKTKYGSTTYWTVPPSERNDILSTEEFRDAPIEARMRSNESYGRKVLNDRDIPRTDPLLAKVIEELGTAANGDHAKLQIQEVASGTGYRIDEYDGNESVVLAHEEQWLIAP